jgi:hypothetical protein
MGGYLGGEVLEDGGEVDGGAGADALGVASLLEVATDAADGELQPRLDGARHRLLPLAALPSGHLRRGATGGTGGWTVEERALLLRVVGMELLIWIGGEGAAFMGTVELRGSGVRSVGEPVPPIRTQGFSLYW